jgi:ribosomal protein S18 acetylase RimI-like enzyme
MRDKLLRKKSRALAILSPALRFRGYSSGANSFLELDSFQFERQFDSGAPVDNTGVMDVRPYTPADHAACLAMFDSNTPRFFDPSERRKFVTFLDAPFCSYFVMEHDGAVVGCGGYAVEEDRSLASLVWGIVRNDLHNHGLGRFLVMFRLKEITRTSGVQMVRLGTSQHTAHFFEKQGFKVAGIEKDGYASGIDRVEMRMKLSVCP